MLVVRLLSLNYSQYLLSNPDISSMSLSFAFAIHSRLHIFDSPKTSLYYAEILLS